LSLPGRNPFGRPTSPLEGNGFFRRTVFPPDETPRLYGRRGASHYHTLQTPFRLNRKFLMNINITVNQKNPSVEGARRASARLVQSSALLL
jgi:hypothetical protein